MLLARNSHKPPMNRPSAPVAIATGAKIPIAFDLKILASARPSTSTENPKDPTASDTPIPASGANPRVSAGVVDISTSSLRLRPLGEDVLACLRGSACRAPATVVSPLRIDERRRLG